MGGRNFYFTCQVTSCKVQLVDGVAKSMSAVDGYCSGDAISRIQHKAGGTKSGAKEA